MFPALAIGTRQGADADLRYRQTSKQWALERNIDVLQPVTLPGTKESLTQKLPDWDGIWPAAYAKYRRKPVLDIPRHGCLNVHPPAAASAARRRFLSAICAPTSAGLASPYAHGCRDGRWASSRTGQNIEGRARDWRLEPNWSTRNREVAICLPRHCPTLSLRQGRNTVPQDDHRQHSRRNC